MSTNTEQKKETRYSITDDGTITREVVGSGNPAAVMATLNGNTATLLPEYATFRQSLKRALNAMGRPDIEIIAPDTGPAIVAAIAAPAPVSATVTVEAAQAAPAPVSVAMPAPAPAPDFDLTSEQRRALQFLRLKEGFPWDKVETTTTSIPPPSSGAGDKDEKRLRWQLRYDPEGFVRTVGLMGMGSKEVVREVRDPATGKPKKARVREGNKVIARRLTVFTDKFETPADLEGGE